jgi:hypothetical protein
MKSKRLRATILEDAYRDFDAMFRRYERYSEFMQEFSTVLEAYRELRGTLEPRASTPA